MRTASFVLRADDVTPLRDLRCATPWRAQTKRRFGLRVLALPIVIGSGSGAARASFDDTTVPRTVVFVDDDAPHGGDGASWVSAHRFLSDALAFAAIHGIDEVRVAQGRYRPDQSAAVPDGTGDRHATFDVPDAVSVLGGFAGIGATDPHARDAWQYRTVLSGDLEGDDDASGSDDNAFHVVTMTSAGPATMIEGVVVTGGVGGVGGGLLVSGGSPLIHGCILEQNLAAHGAAFAFLDGTTARLVGCAIQGNEGILCGGAGIVRGSAPTITSCHFSDNETRDGGALVIEAGASAVVRDSFFTRNRASHIWIHTSGGAIFASAPALFDGCVFTENVATTSGGAIHNAGTDITLVDCTFVGNASSLGGALFTEASGLTTCTGAFICGNLPRDVDGPFESDGTNEFCCHQDMDGDGAVGMSDLLSMLLGWGQCEACAQDLNGDGVVDALDLLILLSAWGACLD